MDSWLLLFLQDHVRNGFLTPVMIFITTLGNKGLIWLLILAALLMKRQTRWFGFLALMAFLLNAGLAEIFLKHAIMRPRPFWAIADLTPLVPLPLTYSFPSVHTVSSFSVAFILWRSHGESGKRAVCCWLPAWPFPACMSACIILLMWQRCAARMAWQQDGVDARDSLASRAFLVLSQKDTCRYLAFCKATTGVSCFILLSKLAADSVPAWPSWRVSQQSRLPDKRRQSDDRFLPRTDSARCECVLRFPVVVTCDFLRSFVAQNIVLLLADFSGISWMTSQCSTIFPSLTRKISTAAWPRSVAFKVM